MRVSSCNAGHSNGKIRSGYQWQVTSMAGVTWRQHRYGRSTPGWLSRIHVRQRLRARLHAGLWAASVVGITDALSVRNVASDVGYLSTSSLPLGLVRGPRAITRPHHFRRPYNRPASLVSPPNRLSSPFPPSRSGPNPQKLGCNASRRLHRKKPGYIRF